MTVRRHPSGHPIHGRPYQPFTSSTTSLPPAGNRARSAGLGAYNHRTLLTLAGCIHGGHWRPLCAVGECTGCDGCQWDGVAVTAL
jgi:hypothetical protein